MPAEPEGPGEPGPARAAEPRGPELVLATAASRPESDPGRHRAGRHAPLAVVGTAAGLPLTEAGVSEAQAGERQLPEGRAIDAAPSVGPATETLAARALAASAPADNSAEAAVTSDDGARADVPHRGQPAGPTPGASEQATGEQSAGRRWPATPAQRSRPEPGSLADLRYRLELLPHGHPSSPYHDDGQRRPQPPRLRHLELAPPVRAVPAREVPARSAAAPYPASPEPASPERASMERASMEPADREQASPEPGDVPPPTPRAAADGSWSWGQVWLSRNLVRVADDAYDRFRAAEGRDLFGRYGNGGLTPMLYRVAERTAHGELAPDSARFALLEPDVFRARFAELLGRHPTEPPSNSPVGYPARSATPSASVTGTTPRASGFSRRRSNSRASSCRPAGTCGPAPRTAMY